MKKIIVFVSVWVLLAACNENKEHSSEKKTVITNKTDRFDRKAMLQNWADNIIIPAYTQLVARLNTLKTSANTFTTTPNETHLTALRTACGMLTWHGSP